MLVRQSEVLVRGRILLPAWIDQRSDIVPMIPVGENPTLELIRQGLEVAECLPDDMPSPDLFRAICGLTKWDGKIKRTGAVVQYYLGHAMAMAMDRPNFLAENGFKEFADFQAAVEQYSGECHGTLWGWKSVAERLPNLTRHQLETISAANLKWIAVHVRESVQEQVLSIAATMKHAHLKRYVEENGYIGTPDEGRSDYVISGTRDQIRELRKFVENDKIQEYAGERPVEILLALIGEAQGGAGISDWPKI